LDEKDSVVQIDKCCVEHISTTSTVIPHSRNKTNYIDTTSISVPRIEVKSEDVVAVPVHPEEFSYLQSLMTEDGLIISENLGYVSEVEGQCEASTCVRSISKKHCVGSKVNGDLFKQSSEIFEKWCLKCADGSDDGLEHVVRLSDNEDNNSTTHDDQILKNLCNLSEMEFDITADECNILEENKESYNSLKRRCKSNTLPSNRNNQHCQDSTTEECREADYVGKV